PGRARTSDAVVNSHLLYQLSYRGTGLAVRTKLTRSSLINAKFKVRFELQARFIGRGNSGTHPSIYEVGSSLYSRKNRYLPAMFNKSSGFKVWIFR
ncbi:MAG: hypothetical protein KDD42_06910, partial [Bdellovibrionales bacterium]|nr:hypothetical protein [Bdellovibrionales bacterium]